MRVSAVVADAQLDFRFHELKHRQSIGGNRRERNEPNNQAPYRSLNDTNGAIGFVETPPALVEPTHYNNPSLFVDISQTETPLFFDHGDGIARVVSNLGNVLMPAGKFLVGSDGALMQDENIAAFSGFLNSVLTERLFRILCLGSILERP